MKYMIGVDVGGTFTDFSVFEQESGRLFHFKHSSTNYDSSVAIVNGILEVLNMEHATAQQVVYLAHGTTVSTNALIEKMVSVLFVGLSDVVNRMQGNFGADRDAYLKMLMRPELLILDDLGAERNTSFGRERVFDVVNKRLLTGKPMIVTTNIPLSVMQKAADLDERRIYDRVLEVCVPIQFNGENFRKGNAAENVKRAAKILNQGT